MSFVEKWKSKAPSYSSENRTLENCTVLHLTPEQGSETGLHFHSALQGLPDSFAQLDLRVLARTILASFPFMRGPVYSDCIHQARCRK